AINYAAASPVTARKGGFSASQVRGNIYPKHGAAATAKTYAKFGVALPDYLAAALNSSNVERRQTGSVEAQPMSYDEAYACQVDIGTPAQTFNLDFDTGSADLWVANSLTPVLTGGAGYNPGGSNTSQATTDTWQIQYGDGSSAGGTVYKDVVSIGGISYPEQAVEVAVLESSQFLQQSTFSGLVGLAFSSLNTASPTKQNTFFDNIKMTLDAPIITADLKHRAPGSYDFGFINQSKYAGEIVYTPVDNSGGFWKFTATGYQIGSDQFRSASIPGIVDTGTSLLYLPNDIVQNYYHAIDGSKNSPDNGGWVFPCNNVLPNFSFGVGNGALMSIPGDYLNYASNSDGSCYGGLQDSSDIGFAIFGDVALKASFVVFDGSESPRLGWANKPL
ncbi:eukaryotic aspartyl protease, partial [Pseudomassariella vexata]